MRMRRISVRMPAEYLAALDLVAAKLLPLPEDQRPVKKPDQANLIRLAVRQLCERYQVKIRTPAR